MAPGQLPRGGQRCLDDSQGERERRSRRPSPGLPLAAPRSLPLLRPPRRRLPGGQRAPRARRVPRRPSDGTGLRGQGRLAHVPRARRPGLPPAPAPRLRDGDHRPPRSRSITPTRSARRPASAAATRSGSTAGGGSSTPEMFPPAWSDRRPIPLELFPDLAEPPAARQASVAPHFAMPWAEGIPRLVHVDAAGKRTEVSLYAGSPSRASFRRSAPPPRSWAARPENGVAIWTVRLEARRVVDAVARRRRRREPHSLLFPGIGHHGGRSPRRFERRYPPPRRCRGRPSSPVRMGPISCSSRGGPSASRWSSTGRS